MATAKEQAARVLRREQEIPAGESAEDISAREGGHRADDEAHPTETPSPDPVREAPVGVTSSPKKSRRRLVLFGLAALAVLAVAGYGIHYLVVGRFMVATDDAYVRANNTTLGARVSGHILAILPGDNSLVHRGDVLFRIDDGDYRIAVDAARSKIATQKATIERIGRQVVAQQSAVEQAKAQWDSAEAALKRAGLDFDRQQALSSKGFASRATFESSEAGRDQGLAAVKSAEAAYNAARDNVEVSKAQQQEARAQLAELETSLARAERDLGFTMVRAPVDGTFSNRLVNLGDLVQAGQRLGNVVPLDDVFIDANFKETQLKRIRPGQPATISVDAYGHRKFAGVVDSISPAAGSVFTLLPPDNATGNFTKIVQRLPVRLRVPKAVARQNLLRAGMSVYVTVDTAAAAADVDSDADLDAPGTVGAQ